MARTLSAQNYKFNLMFLKLNYFGPDPQRYNNYFPKNNFLPVI